MRIVSLFSGCGGLDLGFKRAGFKIVWANEFDRSIIPTFRKQFSKTELDSRSISDIDISDIPDADGIVGGPPCQSWSEFGSKRGIDDDRGKLFLRYVDIIEEKRPKFFLAENVSGILAKRHYDALDRILASLSSEYEVRMELLNAADFGVPQDRERVIFIGYRRDLKRAFDFSGVRRTKRTTLRDAIWDLRKSAVPAAVVGGRRNRANASLAVPNHEYFKGTYSPHYMSRNRVRGWDERSFTIQAGARHAPMHPQAPKMVSVGKDKFAFDGDESLYRRLSVRECARVQTFPDSFVFVYDDVACGYKMVGNAVPVRMAKALAGAIKRDFS